MFDEREKDTDSIEHKLKHRKLPIIDLYGSRFAYLSNADLKECINLQKRANDHVCSLTWMKGTIVYYYFKDVDEDEMIEVQLWPFAALTNFHKDTGSSNVSATQVKLHKLQQLVLQKEIDRLCDNNKHIFQFVVHERFPEFEEKFSKVCKQLEVDYRIFQNTFEVTITQWQFEFIKQKISSFLFDVSVCKQ